MFACMIKELTALKNEYEDAVKDKINARNKLAVERIRHQQTKRYLEAYQHLYVAEVTGHGHGK